MVVDDNSIISYIENEKERKEEIESKFVDKSKRGIGNMVYINVRVRRDNMGNKESSIENKNDDNKNFRGGDYISVRVRLCAATPASIISNRTPPPASQKHHFTQKHQINFCIDEIHRVSSQRRSADTVPNLIYFHYGTSNCKPETSSGIRE